MRLTGIDHRLELRVRQKAVLQDGGGQPGAVAGFWWCDRGHGRRLHQFGRVRFRPGDVDRLQAEGLVNRVGKARTCVVLGCITQRVGQFLGLDLCSGLIGLGRRGRARCADGRARGAGRISREEGGGAICSRYVRVQRKARGDMGGDLREQAGDIRRYRARQIGSDAARLAATAFVEHRNPRLESWCRAWRRPHRTQHL